MRSPRISGTSGFTLIEIVIAAAIITIVFSCFAGINLQMGEKFSLAAERITAINALERERNDRMMNSSGTEAASGILFERGSGSPDGRHTVPIRFGYYTSAVTVNADGSIE